MFISYDGITLPYSEGTQFTQETVYDDFSHADAVGVKFTVVTNFVINSNYLQLLDPAIYRDTNIIADVLGVAVDYTPAMIVNALARRLRKPRRALSLRFADVEMVPPREGKGYADAANGPMPIHFKWTELNSTTFVCEYRIEATYVDTRTVNPGDGVDELTSATRAGGGVLYHRWQETVEMDNCEYSRRVRKGRLTVRADNPQGLTVDAFRKNLVTLSVPEGFVRESSNYTATADGLSLDYEITDKQVFNYPPAKAYKAEGSYREYGRSFNAAIRYADCRVKLWGSRTSPTHELLLTAIRIVGTKLRLAGADVGARNVVEVIEKVAKRVRGRGPAVEQGEGIAQSVELTVDLYENVVEYRVLARFAGNRRKLGGVAGFRKHFAEPPVGSVPPVYHVRGTSNLVLQAAAFWDPQLSDPRLNKGTIRDKINSEVRNGGEANVQLEGRFRPGECGANKEPL